MNIEVFDKLEDMEAVKSSWKDVHAADPSATVYNSWPWMRAWCDSAPNCWIAVAFKDKKNGKFIAFIVLGKKSHKMNRLITIKHLFIAGVPFADHCGFVCLAEYTNGVLSAFAAFMNAKKDWDAFILKEILDDRAGKLLSFFTKKQLVVSELDGTVAPYMQLPKSWDEYLKTKVNKRFRKKINSSINNIKKEIDFRLTIASKEDLQNAIDILLDLKQNRFDFTKDQIFMFNNVFRRCHEVGILHLLIIWDDQTPVAAWAGFLDRPRSTISAYMSGFHEKYAHLSPGVAIRAFVIQFAIENNYSTFDFGRGNEEYKYRYGVSDRYNRNIVIRRRNFGRRLKNLVGRI